jgi:hypothetical protein
VPCGFQSISRIACVPEIVGSFAGCEGRCESAPMRRRRRGIVRSAGRSVRPRSRPPCGRARSRSRRKAKDNAYRSTSPRVMRYIRQARLCA